MIKLKRLFNSNLVLILIILAVELILLEIFMPNFISFRNFITLCRQSSITAILAIGMGIVLISGGIDLSIGAIVAMLGMAAAKLITDFQIPATAAGFIIIIFGSLIGLLNGALCARIRIHPFIITTALSVIYRGTANVFNNGRPVYGIPENLLRFDKKTLLGIPYPLLILFACILIASYILRKTYLGKYIYAIGLDERTAEYSGINAGQIKMIVYSLSGFFYGIAAILLLSKVGSAQPTATISIELDLLAAAAIGGIGFRGGRGHILNIVIGVLIIEILGNTLIIFNVGEYYRYIFKGIVLLTALFMDGALRQNRVKPSKI
ncbi:MAG: ABC transporter permease [Spirochaetales bacterium]|uniref:ABC transporter permease n=1 Tax=Candidatus Thalassospirochaeta sargassi TaxID=3119039 RepID=A0AAJ1IEL1_9SPIO|nr:ABC transporter permease [Spirochaetales bacterium]